MRTAIVLAGGRSSRFGADKLVADVGGGSVLAAAIETAKAVADGVIVAGPALPTEFDRDDDSVAVVRDAEPFAGPLTALAGILARLPADPSNLAIVIAGDMPRLVPSVLVSMLDRVESHPSIDAVLLQAPPTPRSGHGMPERRAVLPLAVRIDAARTAAGGALEAGQRSLHALLDRLSFVELPANAWRALDPNADTLLDVDTPADLDRIRDAGRAEY
jgi:molybdopterin-guanine dinucleotide biosynthesis protein A